MNAVQTYMSFTTPADPAKIQTIPDMDMSYALASTLVEWGPDKQPSAGIAEKWAEVAPHTFRFTIRNAAKWSDGKALASQDIKKSFERGFKTHPIDLRSLNLMIDKIDCPNAHEIDLKLKPHVHLASLLGKLTEPNYGVLKVDGEDKISLSVTTGPFVLAQSSNAELVLKANAFWHGKQPGMPDQVVIKKPAADMDSQTVLLKDTWANLMETSSLISDQTLNRYRSEKFEIRKRPLDKFFHLQLSKRRANAEGRQLLSFLHAKTQRSDFTNGLSGFSEASQVFPVGYQLYDALFACPKQVDAKLPQRFQKKPIEILFTPARVPEALRQNIKKAVTQATGIEPLLISVPLEELRTTKMAGEFDLYAGSVGLADPDPEGAMSFYLEGQAPVIPHNDNHFLARLDEARKQSEPAKKLSQMKSILRDAVCESFLLPLFHLSTVGIARPELDLSFIPQSDESVTLSKIRFRNVK